MFVRNKKLLAASYFIAIFGAVLFVQRASASAATITVSGGCSIENAVASANADANTGGCTGSGTYGDDTISIPAGTWTLASQPNATGNTTITGAGQGQTIIDGGGTVDGLGCDGSAGKKNFVVSHLTITGTPNGAIGSELCNLAVNDVEITNGSSGAIFANLSEEGENYTFDVSNVYIHGNELAVAIGIIVDSTSTGGVTVDSHITNVTIVNNTVLSPIPYQMGILINDKYGDGNVLNTWIRNATISNGDNSIAIQSFTNNTGHASLSLINNTLVGNHSDSVSPLAGGLTLGGDTGSQIIASLQNNIFNDNTANCYIDGGPAMVINSLGYNLADDATCGTATLGDQFNVATIQDFLGPVQNNGGLVPTMELLAGSTAIDAGSSESGLETDARGIARPQGSAYDIGAFEVQQAGSGNNSGGNAGQNTNNSGSGGSSGGSLAETGAHLISPVLLLLALTSATYGTIRLARKKNLYRSINR